MIDPITENYASKIYPHFGTHWTDQGSNTRLREYTTPRKILIFLLRNNTGWTYFKIAKEVAELVGRPSPYDHATMYHSFKSISDTIRLTDTLSKKIANIVTGDWELQNLATQITQPLKTPIPCLHSKER